MQENGWLVDMVRGVQFESDGRVVYMLGVRIPDMRIVQRQGRFVRSLSPDVVAHIHEAHKQIRHE